MLAPDTSLPPLAPLPLPQKYVPLDLRSKKTRAMRRRLTKAQVRTVPELAVAC